MLAVDKPQDECGVIGISAPGELAARMAYFGLHALQHRGQEAAGIASADGQMLYKYKNTGLVAQIFNPENLTPLLGDLAIGHVRYSTCGGSSLLNVQPFWVDTRYGALALAHNGNLINGASLRDDLLRRGIGLQTTSDTGVMTMMLAAAQGDSWEQRIQNTMPLWQGAYSLVILTRDKIFAVRDPWGFRPLSVGNLANGGHAVASESGALQTIGCHDIREVQPGEIITLYNGTIQSVQGMPAAKRLARCTFEHIYFSRPDSVWDALSTHHVRQRLGEVLWEEAPAVADVVIPVPDSSMPAALGYAKLAGIPYNDGFIKNRYIGRTFIQPTDSLRKQGVALKFNVLKENVQGKRLVMIDDSIVRGNTSGPLVKMLRDAGATEVHVRITCPPITNPCFMGVDMGSHEELIAHRLSVEQIRDHIGCDSLQFLSLDGMMRAIGRDKSNYCNACFTGQYPLPIDEQRTRTGFEDNK